MPIITAILFFLFLIAPPVAAISQPKQVHNFLQDDTLLKRKYFNEALQKKQKIESTFPKEYTKDYTEAYNSMFTVVEELLISHRSVTEQAADNYIKAVVAKIIAANPELAGLESRVVFSRDFSPNAYSIGDGTIAFNAGLFIFLNNEAEMAFVICHELAHYYLEHSKKNIDRQVQLLNSDSLKKELKRLSKQEYKVGEEIEKLIKVFAFDARRHSRRGEEEADRVGLRFLKNTGYSGDGFITSMQLLDKIDDTTLAGPLQLEKLFSFPGYSFKNKWIQDESAIFGAMKDDDATTLTKSERDSLKTHPDCLKRIALLQDDALQIKGRHFQINEKLFKELQQNFIPEMMEEVYKSGNISFNLYLSLQMLQEKKYVPLAIYSIARALNTIYQHQQEHRLGLIIDSEDKGYDKEYNLLIRMFYRIRLSEIAELNANFCSYYAEQMKEYTEFTEEMKKATDNKTAHQ